MIRCEFVGGEFLYAFRADTFHGFELPAEFFGLYRALIVDERNREGGNLHRLHLVVDRLSGRLRELGTRGRGATDDDEMNRMLRTLLSI
jgi:hypothetical protein